MASSNCDWRQILTVFFVGVTQVLFSTACNGATAQGNPNNPAVQAGGANNPYKSLVERLHKLKDV